ncbi:hypothetical protein M9Y10_031745 [Tritrichomonas musculus]|uniref:RING-type domain-containing protein n=1 Tax=Tritrichomonas musculus TaxID=1915356 RepID=A0ABR2GZR8_9EUKA
MFKDLVDIKTLFDIEITEKTVLHLTDTKYDFSDKEIGISIPLVIKSTVNSVFTCKKLIILSSNFAISGVKFNGSIIIEKQNNIKISNCSINQVDRGNTSAIIINHGENIILDNLTISNLNIPAILADSQSTLLIKYCQIFNISDSLIYITNSSRAVIDHCELHNSQRNGVSISYNSDVTISNTEIYHCHISAIECISSILTVSDSNLHDIALNCINLSHCKSTTFLRNKFKEVGASSISVSFRSKSEIRENTFENINGNGIFVSEESNALIINNKLSLIRHPAIAVLQSCTVLINGNDISKTRRHGICIRGAKEAIAENNKIDDIVDCAFSVSDSYNCKLLKNSIKNCKIAAIESYNMSNVTFTSNHVSNCGKFGIMVYSRGEVTVNFNLFENISEAFVYMSTCSNGHFTNNEVKKCQSLLIDKTAGNFLFKDNGSFENISNIENCSESDVKKVSKFIDPLFGKCLKCGAAPREGFNVPCGHRIFCEDCGKKAVEANEVCPLCRFNLDAFTAGFSSSEGSLCSICLEKKADTVVLPCGHTGFCADCMNEWFHENCSCPLCRTDPAIFKKIIPDY